MSTAGPLGLENILRIAKKYYEWAEPRISIGRAEFKDAVNWRPLFDGKKKDYDLAAKLSCDTCIVGSMGRMGDMAVALACAAFDAASDDEMIAQNLGCSIAIFRDNNTDPAVRSRQKEIYEDAATVLQYAISLSMTAGAHTKASLGPLTALGNLYLDMKKFEEAKNLFMTARKIDDSYMQAISGLMAYYKATNNPQFIPMMLAAAKKKPTGIGKAANKIEENNKKSEKLIKEGGEATEEELEKMIDLAETVEAPNHGDMFEFLNPRTAEKIISDMKGLQSMMKITIPNIHILTAFTDITEDNQISVKCAVEAVKDDVRYLERYAKLHSRGMGNMAADIMENTGMGDFKYMGMNFHDFMRDISNNPGKYDNIKNMPDAHLRMDNMEKFVREAQDSVRAMSSARQGFGDESTAALRISKVAAKANLLAFPLSLNPFEYSNPYDILIQQYNVPLLVKKKQVFDMYCITVLRKDGMVIADVQRNFAREHKRIKDLFDRDMELLREKKEEDDRKAAESMGGEGVGGGYAPGFTDDQYRQELHALHLKYYPQLNQCTKRYWLEATGVAARLYKKLERNLPRLYKDLMKHIMVISDEKVRRQQEDQVVGMLATTLISAIGMVLDTYGNGEILRIEMCGCDTQDLERMREELRKETEKTEREMLQRQKAKQDSFKNSGIEANSATYLQVYSKADYELDWIVIKQSSNGSFTKTEVCIPFGLGSINRSLYNNHITGAGSYSRDITLGGKLGPAEIKATFGMTLAWDGDGRLIADGFDLRAGLEASVGKGPVSATAGISASLMRGTAVYGEISLTGNNYLDGMKEKILGENILSDLAVMPESTVKRWEGRYVITEKN